MIRDVNRYIVINIISPIILGLTIYIGDKFNLISKYISNYFPDGLWAYSFTSTIIIIWNGKMSLLWLTILGISFISFEFLQFIQMVKGTGDLLDILIYFLFGFASIFLNEKKK